MGNFKVINYYLISLILALSINFSVDGQNYDSFRRSRLCRNYPDEQPPYRFHRETRRCYQVGQKAPCPPLMRFTLENDDYGFCDCDLSLRCGRPLVYWPSRDRCYHVYDEGPCREGRHIVFGFDLEPVCRKNICMEKEKQEPNSGARYWFSFNNTCYKTYTKGYCSEPDEMLYNMKLHYRPTCQKYPDCGKADPIQIAKCLPGQRLDVLGHCQRKFIPLRNTTKDLSINFRKKPTNIYCLFCDGRKRRY